MLKKLWRLFRENGIQVPHPQRDLNLRNTPALKELIAALREGEQRSGKSQA